MDELENPAYDDEQYSYDEETPLIQPANEEFQCGPVSDPIPDANSVLCEAGLPDFDTIMRETVRGAGVREQFKNVLATQIAMAKPTDVDSLNQAIVQALDYLKGPDPRLSSLRDPPSDTPSVSSEQQNRVGLKLSELDITPTDHRSLKC